MKRLVKQWGSLFFDPKTYGKQYKKKKKQGNTTGM